MSILSIIALVTLLSTKLVNFSRFTTHQNSIESANLHAQMVSHNLLKELIQHEKLANISANCINNNNCDLAHLAPERIKTKYQNLSYKIKTLEQIPLPVHTHNKTNLHSNIITFPEGIRQYLFHAELVIGTQQIIQKSHLLYSLFLKAKKPLEQGQQCYIQVDNKQLLFTCPSTAQFIAGQL